MDVNGLQGESVRWSWARRARSDGHDVLQRMLHVRADELIAGVLATVAAERASLGSAGGCSGALPLRGSPGFLDDPLGGGR